MQYGTARFTITNGGRYSLSYAQPLVQDILNDSLYKGSIVYNGLTTEYFFYVPDGTDLSELTAPFGIKLFSTPNDAINWVTSNTTMQKIYEGVFEISPEINDPVMGNIPQKTLTIN